jgi:hypothetical protein
MAEAATIMLLMSGGWFTEAGDLPDTMQILSAGFFAGIEEVTVVSTAAARSGTQAMILLGMGPFREDLMRK